MTGDVAWRLDVLDPVGGLAFASHRQSDGQAARLDTTLPAVFISAPTFQPVSVRSRAIGLAAARRSFQPGLFIEGDEVGFPELEDAIEFIRRCYQNGGGGAGTGGGGAPPLGPEGPEPELPQLPDLEHDREERTAEVVSIMTSLRSDLELYEKRRVELKGQSLGKTFHAHWSRPARFQLRTDPINFPGSRSKDGVDILVRGATRILAEMIRRLPLATKNPDALVNWQGAWFRLTMIVEQMGVLNYLYDRYSNYLKQLFNSVGSKIHDKSLQDWLSNYLSLTAALEDLMWHRRRGLGSTDAFDDLAVWPSPTNPALRPQLATYQKSLSLLNRLAVFLSAPLADDGSGSVNAEIELVLFAAARLVLTGSRENQALTLTGGYPRFWLGEPVHRRAVERLAETAWEWLADQLPKRGFEPSLERAIASTSTLIVA